MKANYIEGDMLYKKKSKIHGYGLFSDKPFKKGDLIGEFKIKPAIYHTKFSIYVDDQHFKAVNILKYSNHSKNPNCEIDFPRLIAKKDIKINEELVWDYGNEFN